MKIPLVYSLSKTNTIQCHALAKAAQWMLDVFVNGNVEEQNVTALVFTAVSRPRLEQHFKLQTAGIKKIWREIVFRGVACSVSVT